MSWHPDIHIERTQEQLAEYAAGHIVESLLESIKARGSATFLLSGGSTPRRVYQMLATKPFRDRLEWNRIHVFFGDERMVPPDHVESNYAMARRELISRVPVPPDNVHRIRGELKPEEAALKYSEELRKIWGEEIPRFDVALLGIGEDGHTASLFPGTTALEEHQRLAVALLVPRLGVWRVSLTFPVLNNAREIVFLVEGKKKSSVVRSVVESPSPTPAVPSSMIRPTDGVLRWFLDSEAASLLPKQTH